MNRLLKIVPVFILFLITLSCTKDSTSTMPDGEFTIWSGETITFTKQDGSDPNDEANQDRLTASVWITRGNDGGQIYNIAEENDASKNSSPSGTLWAEGTTADIESLTFRTFRDGIGGKPKTNLIGKDLVLHLVEDNVYLDIRFTSWSTGQKGGFSYTRTTPR